MPAERRHRRLLRVVFATVASCVLHVAFFEGAALSGVETELPFDLVVPSELTLGVADAVEVEALAPPPPPPDAPSPAATMDPAAGEAAADAGVRRRDAGVDAAVADASADAALDAGIGDADTADAGEASTGDAATAEAGLADAAPADGGDAGDGGDAPPASVSSRATEGRLRLPPGGAVALRLDLSKVRGTPLEPEVEGLLAENPDFQKVLGQAGLDVVRDVDQFVMASPVPYDRTRYLFLARVPHDAAWVRARVDATAAAHGRTVAWGETEGFPSAPWIDDDVAAGDTERLVLLLDAHHLLVVRPSDVRVALAWLRASANSEAGEDGAGGIVGLGPDELLSLQVDGARRYVGGVDLTTIPTALRLSLTREDATFELRLRGDYPADEEAEAGATYFGGLRDQAADQLRGGFLTRGYANLLDRIDLETNESRVRAHVSLPEATTLGLVGMIRAQMPALYRGLAEAGRQDRGRE